MCRISECSQHSTCIHKNDKIPFIVPNHLPNFLEQTAESNHLGDSPNPQYIKSLIELYSHGVKETSLPNKDSDEIKNFVFVFMFSQSVNSLSNCFEFLSELFRILN